MTVGERRRRRREVGSVRARPRLGERFRRLQEARARAVGFPEALVARERRERGERRRGVFFTSAPRQRVQERQRFAGEERRRRFCRPAGQLIEEGRRGDVGRLGRAVFEDFRRHLCLLRAKGLGRGALVRVGRGRVRLHVGTAPQHRRARIEGGLRGVGERPALSGSQLHQQNRGRRRGRGRVVGLRSGLADPPPQQGRDTV